MFSPPTLNPTHKNMFCTGFLTGSLDIEVHGFKCWRVFGFVRLIYITRSVYEIPICDC